MAESSANSEPELWEGYNKTRLTDPAEIVGDEAGNPLPWEGQNRSFVLSSSANRPPKDPEDANADRVAMSVAAAALVGMIIVWATG